MTTLGVEYGLNPDELWQLQREADGRCQRCGAQAERLAIDHDHAAGRTAVRGLVCYSCNQHLGRLDNGHRLPDEQDLVYLAGAWWTNHRPEIEEPERRPYGWRAGRNKTQHVNLRVPEKHMKVVREAAEEMELNQSDVIRLAVEEWVERREAEK